MNVIETTGDREFVCVDHLLEDGASVVDVPHRKVHVGFCDAIDKRFVLRRAISCLLGPEDSGAKFLDHAGQVAHLEIIARALDRTTACVAEQEDKLGAGDFARELHAAEDVFVDKVSRNPNAEDVAEPLIKNELCTYAAIDAAQDRGEGELRIARLVHLCEEISIRSEVLLKTSIALFKKMKGVDRAHLFLSFACKGPHVFLSFVVIFRLRLEEPRG